MPLVAREYEGGWNKFSSCMGIISRARLGGVFALSYKTVKHNALAYCLGSWHDLRRQKTPGIQIHYPEITRTAELSFSAVFCRHLCSPLSPFILISNTRERLHHVFWLSCPKWQQRHLPQSNASCKVKHGNIKFRDLENKMFLWQRCPGNLPLAQTWKLLLERILHLIARINSDHNYQHQWIAARFNTLSLGLLPHWAESRKRFPVLLGEHATWA